MNTKAAIFLYFKYMAHCHDLFCRTALSHENFPHGIQNRGHCSLNHEGEITQKV